jgi:hypothetical protein
VLSQEKPFSEVKTEGMLCAKVHQGYRPSLANIPPETPAGVIAMIECCWDKEREKRKSAVQCLSILEYHLGVMMETKFDIYFSHSLGNQFMLSYVFHHLTQTGYRVWFDQNQTDENDIQKATSEGL